MNRAARKRLQAAISRLTLRKTTTAHSFRGRCCFCTTPIGVGDPYKSSGSLQAHLSCVTAVSADCRTTEAGEATGRK
jgi:hypothetical protein